MPSFARGVLTIARSLLLVLCLCSLPALGQLVDEAPVRLSEEQRQQLQSILDAPVDSRLTYLEQSKIYRQKDAAAMRLGDVTRREALLREWAKFDDDGRWNLRLLLAAIGRTEEADAIAKEMLRARRGVLSSVRLRLRIAATKLGENKMGEAATLISEAEVQIRRDFGSLPRTGDIPFFIIRAELDFHSVKASLLRRNGKWADAIEQAKLAVEKGRRLSTMMDMVGQDIREYAYDALMRAWTELAQLQASSGLYAEAEWSLREAYKSGRANGLHDAQLVFLYARIADYYVALGQFNEALGFAERVGRINEAIGLRAGSMSWLVANLYAVTSLAGAGQWTDAQARIDRLDAERAAITEAGTSRSVGGNERLLRGYVALNAGRHVQALEPLQVNFERSQANFGEDHYFTAINRGLFASALFRNGQEAVAKAQFERSLRGLTAPESLTGDFVESAFQRQVKRFILQSYMHLLARTARTDARDAKEIFQVADQLTTSSVQQALTEAAVRAGVSTPGLADIIRKEQDAKNEIAVLTGYISSQGSEAERRRNPQVVEQMYERLKQLAADRKGYKAQIQKDFPAYFQLVQPRSPSHQDIAAQLKSDELFLAVVPMTDGTYVWAIDSQGGIRFHVSALGEGEVRKLVERIRATLDVAGFGATVPRFDFEDAARLYAEIFQPFDAQIDQKKHLIVATSGVLAQLPFSALPRRPHPSGALADAPWLVRDVGVTHVPSSNGWLSLKGLTRLASAPQPLIAWGDPLFDIKQPAPQSAVASASVRGGRAQTRSADLNARNVMDPDNYLVYSRIPPLPETRDEVQELARILDADATQDLVLGAGATRRSVLQSSQSGQLARKRVVVFATHGLLAGDLPNLNQPALAMASTAEAGESPLLTLEDVLGLKLNADWVVLSACNTAGADGRAEEALSGLARGFFYAGSRSLLVTHWSVESRSAMLLTTSTFEAYKSAPDMTRAQALRQAMLQVMSNPSYAHPAFWAPYALVGEGSR